MKLDLRLRCKRCRKIPRGEQRKRSFEQYAPYCSYHCQEWAKLEGAHRYLQTIRNPT